MNYLSTLPAFSTYIWFSVSTSLLFLSAILMIGGSRYRYPYFTTLVHFTAGGCTALLVIARFGGLWPFFWSYFVYRVAWDIMAALVAREIYVNVFGPSWALPRSVPGRVAANLAIVVSSAASVGIILRATAGNKALRYGTTGEGMLYGALAGTFLVLYLLSRKLSITWHWRMRQIAGGMALILLTNTATTFLRGHSSGTVGRYIDDIGQLAYLFSFLFWSLRFLQAERPAPARDPEILRSLAHRLRNAQTRAAALGVNTEGS